MNNQNKIIPYVGLVPKETHRAKTNLHDDFNKNAKINGIVSYIYYPSGEAKQGHAELEVEGECWSVSCTSIQHESLERKIKRSTTIINSLMPNKMLGRYFKQYLITISPHQLKQLKESMEKGIELDQSSTSSLLLSMAQGLTYKTCSYHVLSKLSENSDFNIPMPYKISPLLTELYIKRTKPSTIKQIKEYGKWSGYRGEGGECLFIISALSLPILFLYGSYETLYNY